MRAPATVLALCLLAALLTAGLGLFAYQRPGPLPRSRAIVIPHGSLEAAFASLQAAGSLPPGRLWRQGGRLAARLTRRQGALHAGELAFPAHASLAGILHVLRTAAPVQHHLTIPEGLTAAQIAWLLAREPALSGPLPVPREGEALPATYDFTLDTPRLALLSRMHRAMLRRLDAVWQGRDRTAGLQNRSELLVLASLVERETARSSERPMIARVFLNRLAHGMRLQSDPTAAYAATGGLGALRRPLDRADLGLDNPYNTYAAAGLPPGPICAPGLAALQAVAHPATGDALFFVADGTGGHAFAADLAQHLRHVAVLRARQAADAH